MPKGDHGFTLVEMLVVVAIIGILAALLMPALQRAVGSARTAGCANNLRQQGMIIFRYADEYNGCIPPSGPSLIFPSPDYGEYGSFMTFMHGYSTGRPIKWWGHTGTVENGIYLCPADSHPDRKLGKNDQRKLSYSHNYRVWQYIANRSIRYGSFNAAEGQFLRMAQDVRSPSLVGLCGDAVGYSLTDGRAGGLRLLSSYGLFQQNDLCWGDGAGGGVRLSHPAGSGFLMIYADGHVEASFYPVIPNTMISNWLKTQ